MARRYENDIDLRQLRYFVAVAEELHFGRAAARLGMAQPPLTQQIQKLEAALGCPVFLRQPRKTTLTAAGMVLLEEARRLLADVGQAVEQTRRAGRGETGQLRVGVPPSVMLTQLPSAIRKYRERFPEVQFTLREMATSAIEAALAANQLDIGFLRAEAAEGFSVEFQFEEGVVAVLPAKHPLASKPRLALRHLALEPFVFFPRRLGGSSTTNCSPTASRRGLRRGWCKRPPSGRASSRLWRRAWGYRLRPPACSNPGEAAWCTGRCRD